MPNALAAESSPYLRQHADNPVDWLPWSQQALDLARRKNKPILLSIGYSACHWCHVMAHESFADEATAALMNRHFVNIKVDREERPDIDRIYQTAHQLIARRPGGWPLTMFLTPDEQLPFFGGTYFPNRPRHGMLAFPDLLERIVEIYTREPDKVRQQATALQQALIDIELHESQNRGAARIESLELFDAQLLKIHDREHGGFGRAPKFPQPAILLQATRRAAARGDDDELRRAVIFSLRQIARGGIQDHVGGGFYRYSVDDQWMIPHFEKMLYDNGQLLEVFAEAYRVSAEPLFRDAVDGIVGWLERDMQTPAGAFYAALDADSEGAEGKYYLWTPREAKQALGSDDYRLFAWRFGLDRKANFEGRWHLHGFHDADEVAAQFGLTEQDYNARHAGARQRLLEVRAERQPPGLDDKLLTAWNALVIRGLAVAAKAFGRTDYLERALRCLAALRADCWQDGRLYALGAASGKRLPAYLDDYAHLLQACLDCLQLRWDGDLLEFARELAAQLLQGFADETWGGFFFTARDHEKLIQRPKSWADEAMPSGNAVAALALHRLGLLIGDEGYCDSAWRALQSVADNVNQTPMHAAGFVTLLEVVERPPRQIIVRGDSERLEQWQAALLPRLGFADSAYFIPRDAPELPDALSSKSSDATAAAWICEGFSCRAPIFEIDELLETIDQVAD